MLEKNQKSIAAAGGAARTSSLAPPERAKRLFGEELAFVRRSRLRGGGGGGGGRKLKGTAPPPPQGLQYSTVSVFIYAVGMYAFMAGRACVCDLRQLQKSGGWRRVEEVQFIFLVEKGGVSLHAIGPVGRFQRK